MRRNSRKTSNIKSGEFLRAAACNIEVKSTKMKYFMNSSIREKEKKRYEEKIKKLEERERETKKRISEHSMRERAKKRFCLRSQVKPDAIQRQ